MRWKLLILLLLIQCVALCFPKESLAQSNTTVTSVRRNIATVIFCGVGGAVLGISTLSFYGDPQNHVGNITSGLALGLIAGGVYVGMQATEPSKDASLDTLREIKMRAVPVGSRPLMAWNWTF